MSRAEALAELVFYAAAAVLAVVLPLHVLEHVPVEYVQQPLRTWVLWLVLIFAGIHGSLGLRSFLLERASSRAARVAATAFSLALGAFVVAVGAWGLVRAFGW